MSILSLFTVHYLMSVRDINSMKLFVNSKVLLIPIYTRYYFANFTIDWFQNTQLILFYFNKLNSYCLDI